MPTREDLKYYQSLPLDMKIAKTKDNIREFVREFGVDDVYVSFSGGKDSTVLLDIARNWKPNDKGLGLRHVFDVLNGIYGDDFIRYE